ncbi:RHS repeat-associated core domain-containing protein [Tunturibacter psychrotolerans]|uniref:RHS repeat-associated core domain-containing protein n=1 Tax=Tunturiibacter psychrotolerans TaxID=3069686 RepID=A0AAU7ZVB0_9BACT
MKSLCIAFACLFSVTTFATAQFPQLPGLVPYQSYDESNFDTVDLVGGGVQLHIPIISYPQKGTLPPLGLQLVYNPPVWTSTVETSGGSQYVAWFYTNLNKSGLVATPNYVGGTFPDGTDNNHNPLSGTTAIDPTGASHEMFGVVSPAGVHTTTLETVDGSGIAIIPGSGFVDRNGISYTGTCTLYNPYVCPTPATSTFMKDPSGNTVTVTTTGGTSGMATFKDSVGRTIPAFGNMSSSSVVAKCEAQQFPIFGGTTAPITICWQQLSAATSFGNGTREGQATFVAISGITLQNGASWRFTYDSWGFLHSVTTPTGAVMTYAYYPPSYTQYPVGEQPGQRFIQSRTLNINGVMSQWSYAYSLVPQPGNGTGFQTTVTDPLGNTIVHLFNSNGTEAQTVYNQGTSPAIKTVQHTYLGGVLGTGYGVAGLHLPEQTTTIYNGQSTTTCVIYDNNTNTACTGTDGPMSGGLKVYDPNDSLRGIPGFIPYSASLVLGSPMYSYTYDYTTSSGPGPLLSETTNTYQWQANDSYRAANLINLKASTSTSSGAQPLASVTITYDETSYSPGGFQGNATSEVDGGTVTTHTYYNANGMVVGAKDGNGNMTSVVYDGTGAYPTTVTRPVTNGVNHIDAYTYDANTGLAASHTDENLQKTTYSYDSMRRIAQIAYPDGGQENHTYNDAAAPSPTITYTKKLTATSQYQIVTTADALGRQVQVKVTSDPIGPIYTNTIYDGDGRTQSVSNPYRSSTDSSYGITSYAYDALGRKIRQCQPDNGSTGPCVPGQSYISWTYTGNGLAKRNELGNVWTQVYDALEHLTRVTEPTTAVTSLSFDALGNLLGINQAGLSGERARVRSYTYDSLSRMICEADSENSHAQCPTSSTAPLPGGVVTYSYDLNGNLKVKTDARGLSSNYSYDSLNRLITKSPSNSHTATDTYNYDEKTVTWNTYGMANTSGRLSSASSSIYGVYSRYTYSYDSMGRLLTRVFQNPNSTGALDSGIGSGGYQYDLAGNVTFETQAAGVYLYETRDTAGHVTAISANKHTTGTLNGISSQQIFANATYDPFGNPATRLLGNGLSENRTYDNRGRLSSSTQFQAGASIGYTTATTYYHDGSAATSADTVNGNWTYSYDSLSRLSGATSAAGLTLAWTYDSFGNRKTQTASGTGSAPQPSFSFTGNNNHADPSGGFAYDYAGNITTDNLGQTYAYDVYSRMVGVNSGAVTYRYDSEGQLVWESGSTGVQVFQRNSAGQPTWIYNPTPNGPPYSLIGVYVDGEQIGSWQHDQFHWLGKDWLGTKRYETAGNGDIGSSAQPIEPLLYTSLPYGDALSSIGTDPTHFTGKERDIESGNDYFGGRYYSSSTGRFMNVDPSGLAYADPTNPQSFNLYSYVLNNPLSFIDSTGLTCQTNSSDGTVYDDNDGNGCSIVDEADRKAAPAVTVYADGSRNLLQEQNDQEQNQYVVGWLQSQAAPAQISLAGREFLSAAAKDTAGVPTVCSVGVFGQIGPGAGAIGGSYDSNSGGKGYLTVRPTPEGVSGDIAPISLSVKGDTNKGFSGGVTVRDPVTRIGGGVSVSDKGVPTVSASWAPFIFTVGATATIGTMGDPKCQPHP